ncbi:non-ribosomal peptide synthetase [Streptomyces flaveolus]|uniref:non-ribosomal peptide synthetase n=1 Tax=Streptomyces flaveolus TaxID=67297 RepID=UPI0033E6BA10
MSVSPITIGAACLHHLFEEQAAARPDAPALLTDAGSLTYDDVNRSANSLARRLLRAGLAPGQPVGLLLERSADFVLAALAVLKAGGHYVPLDGNYPPARLTLILEDSRPALVLTHAATRAVLPGPEVRTLTVDAPQDDAAGDWDKELDTENPKVPVGPDHLAYTMFTSGSTGRPKGVMVPHRAVVRLARGAHYAELDENSVVPLVASVSFDASTFEIWATLLSGGAVAVGSPGVLSLTEIADTVARHRVTSLFLTTGLFHLVVDEQPTALTGVRNVLVGGDALSARRLLALRTAVRGCRVVHAYGPTENTTFTTCHPVPANWRPLTAESDAVPIGTALQGTYTRVLDEEWRQVAPGTPGQLFTGGEGLARGYLNSPGRTAATFVPDQWGQPGTRLYATGDLVRELPDGTLEFLGRIDRQVKIRGYRVEPGEVEAQLRAHPAVRDVAVVAVGSTADDRQLAAYPVLDGEVATSQLRTWLAARVPQHLVPTTWHALKEFPLTVNGKVDRSALPDPTRRRSPQRSLQADVEAAVAAVFTEVLGLERVEPADDFFALGGHSILAAKIVARLRRRVGVELSIAAVFDHPTVAGLASAVRGALEPAAR